MVKVAKKLMMTDNTQLNLKLINSYKQINRKVKKMLQGPTGIIKP